MKIYCESYFEQQKTTEILKTNCSSSFVSKSKRDFSPIISRLIMEKEPQISSKLLEFMELHRIPNIITLLEIDDEKLLKMDSYGWQLMRGVFSTS
jgi:hypothetical protein